MIVKSFLVNSINWSNKLWPAFNRLHKKVFPSFHLIDTFSSQFSFYLANRKNIFNLCIHFHALNVFAQNILFDSGTIIAIVDTSIKNNITIAVSYIFSNYRKLSKKAHYVINVTTTEAKLFAIRSAINKSCQVTDANKIIIITDIIHATKKIFDSLAHPY